MWRVLIGLVAAVLSLSPAAAQEVRVKDLGRFLGWRDNPLVGYGIVVGLGGTGDSPRSQATRQALSNTLGRLGGNIPPDQLQSRNVAVVMVTARLPPAANTGDRIDVTVSSVGDATSLAGGSLLMTPLLGPDQKTYALAQGPVVVGGYRFESTGNFEQKNYPTAAVLSAGATVETPVRAQISSDGVLTFILTDPDFTTAQRVADGINAGIGGVTAEVRGADQVAIGPLPQGPELFRLASMIENIEVSPQVLARVVVNERSGTVVAGGGVRVSSVVVSQGDIKVSVTADNQLAQPFVANDYGVSVRSFVVTNSRLEVSNARSSVVAEFPHTTVADVVQGLQRSHVDTRGIISVLQAMKAAGSLHAQIIIQ